MSVGSDICKIGRDFRCEDVTKNLKYVTNLGSFVRKLNVFSNGVLYFKTIVKFVLSENLSKNDSVRLCKWSSPSFHPRASNL